MFDAVDISLPPDEKDVEVSGIANHDSTDPEPEPDYVLPVLEPVNNTDPESESTQTPSASEAVNTVCAESESSRSPSASEPIDIAGSESESSPDIEFNSKAAATEAGNVAEIVDVVRIIELAPITDSDLADKRKTESVSHDEDDPGSVLNTETDQQPKADVLLGAESEAETRLEAELEAEAKLEAETILENELEPQTTVAARPLADETLAPQIDRDVDIPPATAMALPTITEAPVDYGSEVVILHEDDTENEAELEVPFASRPQGFVKRWTVKLVSGLKRLFKRLLKR